MMRALVCFCLAILFSTTLSAQATQPEVFNFDDLQRLANLNPRMVGIQGFDHRFEGVKGTPFLLEDWQKARILFHQNEDYSPPIEVNFEAETQQLYFRLETGQVGAVPARMIREVQLLKGEEVTAVFRSLTRGEVEDNNDEDLAFYEVLHEGERFTLLKLILKPLIKADFKGAYSPDRRYDEYVAEEAYWLREGDGAFTKIKLKRKALEKALPRHARRIKQYWNKNDLDKGEEEGVVSVLEKIEQ